MPDNREIIDVHCHLFNAHYAIMELIAATSNYFWEDYPHQKENSDGLDAMNQNISAHQGVKEFAAWIARYFNAAFSNCEENYHTAQDKFKESSLGQESSLVVAPLMMDIYFALDDNKAEEKAIRTDWLSIRTVEPSVPENPKKNFDDHVDSIKNIVEKEMQKLSGSTERHHGLEALFNEVRNMLKEHSENLKNDNMFDGIELSPGYMKHMNDLEELREKYPDNVFPFLAVDPRRIGIMELIDIKVNKGNGVFKGIKLYPPLGYLPTHPNLKPIFAYCDKYNIPITLHCSEGGMKNFRSKNYVLSWEEIDNHWEDFEDSNKNKSCYYTAPEKWRPVLREYPNLFINFAHFGGSDQFNTDDNQCGTSWMYSIIGMMHEYPNVYTDIAYFVKKDLDLVTQIQNIIDENEILKTRLMFGTDYVMMEDIGLKEYFNDFSVLDSKLLSCNARCFLGI